MYKRLVFIYLETVAVSYKETVHTAPDPTSPADGNPGTSRGNAAPEPGMAP